MDELTELKFFGVKLKWWATVAITVTSFPTYHYYVLVMVLVAWDQLKRMVELIT